MVILYTLNLPNAYTGKKKIFQGYSISEILRGGGKIVEIGLR